MPMRRQMTCCTPGRITGPYCYVTRPLPSQVSSKTPGALRTPFTRSPARKPTSSAQVVDEGGHGLAEAAALGGCEAVKVGAEARKGLVGGHGELLQDARSPRPVGQGRWWLFVC